MESSTRSTIRRMALVYLVIECIALLGFWAWMWADEGAIGRFAVSGHEGALRMFVLADQGVLALAAIWAAWGVAASKRWARPLAWLHAGAGVYATAAAVGGWYAGLLMPMAALVMAPLGPAAVLVAIGAEKWGSIS